MSIISTNQEGDVELDAWGALNNRADERDELLAIVQRFAGNEPRDGEFGYCIYCSAHDAGEKHDADCVWVQAQKWENK
jgi:hypothetical protein